MSKHSPAAVPDMDAIVENARALIAATANVTGDKVARARKRLAAAMADGQSDGDSAMGNLADIARDNIQEVHKALSAAVEHGKEFCDDVRDTAVEKAKAADHVVRGNPYQAIGIALGVGALLGFVASFRHCRSDG